MKYVFDTNSLIVLFKNFYESRFPTLWRNYNELVSSQKIISVREVAKEITTYYGTIEFSSDISRNLIPNF